MCAAISGAAGIGGPRLQGRVGVVTVPDTRAARQHGSRGEVGPSRVGRAVCTAHGAPAAVGSLGRAGAHRSQGAGLGGGRAARIEPPFGTGDPAPRFCVDWAVPRPAGCRDMRRARVGVGRGGLTRVWRCYADLSAINALASFVKGTDGADASERARIRSAGRTSGPGHAARGPAVLGPRRVRRPRRYA